MIPKFTPPFRLLKMRLNKRHTIRNLTFMLSLSILMGAVSCKKDFLDQKLLSIVNENAVFSDSTYAKQFINSRYENVTYSWEPNRFGNGGLESACDEAEAALSNTEYHNVINSGAADPSNTSRTVWNTSYSQIRAVNIFLKNRNTIPVKELTKKVWEGQMRFLRAWYYATLIKHYGGIPLVADTVYADNDKIDLPRSSYAACVDYVVGECDKAAGLLPADYIEEYPKEPLDYGRATKGAALALKARVLLYAASPLVNDTRVDDPEYLVSYGSANANRWKAAADAAQAVISLNRYTLFRNTNPAFYQTFLTGLNTGTNPELIFAYLPASTDRNGMYRETLMNPPSRGTKYTATITCFPLQELVDAFGMQNGLPISDPASGYPGIGDNMYQNRDPRFYYTITYNGALRSLSGFAGDQPVRTYTGVIPAVKDANLSSAQADGIYKGNATRTGYYSYKMLKNEVFGNILQYRPRLLIRYAEVLLNAAEATNEQSGPTAQIYTWLKDIRSRAGITAGSSGMYGINPAMTKEQMRSFIQNERQVELAFEEHRFWDIRRWKIAPVTENRDMHGMEITRAENGTFSYRSIVVRKHVFRDKMYFWPIPQAEITKSPALKQNPGY
jgi:hypothetical protein